MIMKQFPREDIKQNCDRFLVSISANVKKVQKLFASVQLVEACIQSLLDESIRAKKKKIFIAKKDFMEIESNC